MPFYGELRPFQVEGFERMLEQKHLLLAMSMGLGKTIVTIAAVEELIDSGKVSGGLVIAFSGLKYQWAEQIEKFTNGRADVLVIDGPPKKRMEQYDKAGRGMVEYVILNYEQVVNDWERVRRLKHDFVVADECVALKGFRSRRTKYVKKIQAPYRFGLTGQPVENRLEELFSIMEWVDPDCLGDFVSFDRTFIKRNYFGGVKHYRNLPLLHTRLSESMVRKNRDDPEVAKYMPKVSETSVYAEFDSPNKRLYRRISSDLRYEIAEAMAQFGKSFDLYKHYSSTGSGSEAMVAGKVMSRLTCLRMLCDHPLLLHTSAQRFLDDGDKRGSVYAAELFKAGELAGVETSPKLAYTVDLVKEILTENKRNKVVLFAYFKDALRYIQEALKGVTDSVLFMGGMNAAQKEQSKKQFQNDPGTRLFLSSDAGGYGVDLPQANYLLNYDLPWSAGKIEQRNARIDRLSSEFSAVFVTNILMRKSIEVRHYDMLKLKKLIGSAVVDGKGSDKAGRLEMNLKTLSDFLHESEI